MSEGLGWIACDTPVAFILVYYECEHTSSHTLVTSIGV